MVPVKLMAGAAAVWAVNGPALPDASIIASKSGSHSTSLTGSLGGADASKTHWPETRNTGAESHSNITISFSVLPQNLSAFEPSEAMKWLGAERLLAEPLNVSANTSIVLPSTDQASEVIFRNSGGTEASVDQSEGGAGTADVEQIGHNSDALVIVPSGSIQRASVVQAASANRASYYGQDGEYDANLLQSGSGGNVILSQGLTGSDNNGGFVELAQLGLSRLIEADQSGADAKASIAQAGSGNLDASTQIFGDSVFVRALQMGISGLVSIIQSSDETTEKRPEESAADVAKSGENGTVGIEPVSMNAAARAVQGGAENIADIEQIGGNEHYANTLQTGNSSKISILQIGHDGNSYSNVQQTGYGSSIKIAQIGSGNAVGNVGAFAQLADQSAIGIGQQTERNAINGAQSGLRNQLFIDQVVTQGAKAFVYQAGAENRSDLEQTGSGAYAFVEQSGSYGNLRLRQAGENSAEILQAGYRNNVLVTQLGSGHEVLITQTGSRGRINISQLGSGSAYAEVSQAGGSDNQAFVTQQSLGAFAVITQTGSGSYASILQ